MAIIDKRGTDGFAASIDDIPAAALTQGGNEVHLYPGSYTANSGLTATNYAFVVVGESHSLFYL